jgi:hypothetical protein
LSLALMLLAGAGVWVSSTGTHEADPPPLAAKTEIAPPPAAPKPPGQAPAEPPVTEAPKLVEVTVASEPAGATVTVEGRGEVCVPTPCSFTTERGTPVTIQVDKSGYRASKSEVLPSEDTNDVAVSLQRRGAAKPRPARGNSRVGDLMIPDAFGGR